MAAVSSVYLISIHALREEGDRDYLTSNRILPLFLSTPSARRATQDNQQGVLSAVFLSTPSARRATLSIILPSYQFMISIHALREEGDKRSSVLDQSAPVISIHALREEGDAVRTACALLFCKFLSTPSARRATLCSKQIRRRSCISIHALREEGDSQCSHSNLHGTKFLSTPSARRATSIRWLVHRGMSNFYPRPPRGGRRAVRTACALLFCKFLSTPSARRATWASLIPRRAT